MIAIKSLGSQIPFFYLHCIFYFDKQVIIKTILFILSKYELRNLPKWG